ncbi:hypothetical protein NQ318_009821 [Aromia moschata]|uniref:Uncharacterized protein n=1 Tax=Aromia moschata TaxID=1265417 RepID=A0AAV8XPK2_9CUCU|nr:hypothetical protein NQ318_009821 [Aromia moschata]
MSGAKERGMQWFFVVNQSATSSVVWKYKFGNIVRKKFGNIVSSEIWSSDMWMLSVYLLIRVIK